MQKCEKCHTPFTWGEIYRVLWRFSKKNSQLSCRECNTQHEFTSSIWIFIPFFGTVSAMIVSYFGYRNPDISIFLYLPLTYLVYTIISVIFPFIFKLRSKYHSNYKANP